MIKDAAYLIVNGLWVPVGNKGSVSLKRDSVSTVSTSLTGVRRVLMPYGHEYLRTWDVSCNDVPQSWADAVGTLAYLDKNKTRVKWVPPKAKHSNALYSSWAAGVTETIASQGLSGTPGISTSKTGSAWSGIASVAGGEWYTGSVFTSLAGCTLNFYTVSGQQVGSHRLTLSDGAGRRYVSAQAPADATYAKLLVSSPNTAHGPAISWGQELRAYDAPGACDNAIISDVAESHSGLHGNSGLISYSFKVVELSK